MTILCKNLIPNGKAQATGNTTKPTPVTDKVTENNVEPLMTTVSTYSSIDATMLEAFYFSFDL